MVILPVNIRFKIDAVYPAPIVHLPWEAPEVMHLLLLLLSLLSLLLLLLLLLLLIIIIMWILPANLRLEIDAVYAVLPVSLPCDNHHHHVHQNKMNIPMPIRIPLLWLIMVILPANLRVQIDAGSLGLYTRLLLLILYEAGLAKRRPGVGFAVTVPSAPFCTSTTAGGTGRVQPRLLCKNRDHPVTASSDTAAKLATPCWFFQRKRPHPLSTANRGEVVWVRTRQGWGAGVLTSRLCRRAVGGESPRARSLAPVGLLGGYADVGARQRQGRRSVQRARTRWFNPLGDLLASVPTESVRTARAEETNSNDFELRQSACRQGVFWRDQPRMVYCIQKRGRREVVCCAIVAQ